MAEFGPEIYRTREEQGKIARQERLANVQHDLSMERETHKYLVEKQLDGAARRVLDNITKLEQRVTKYTQEL